MSLFNYSDEDILGQVISVDTASVNLYVSNIEILRKMQVNRLVALRSSRAGQHLIGIVNKIIRKSIESTTNKDENDDILGSSSEDNVVRITLIGTFFDRLLTKSNIFRRTLETVPEIDAPCYSIEGTRLTNFMKAISYQTGEQDQSLSLGTYTLDEDAIAFLDANRFFQRHAVIVGSTGSGKSWTTARLLEQVSELTNSNAILFDIHGEYGTLDGDGIRHFRIAGPADLNSGKGINDGILYFPYWLLGYEDMTTMLVDRSDQNAPNQSMVLSRTVTKAKQEMLLKHGDTDIINNFTVDSPVPYDLDLVVNELVRLDTEMVPGARGEKQGEFFGRLSRFISRLQNKKTDRRLSFMMAPPKEVNDMSWLNSLAKALISGRDNQADKRGGVKIINFSEVPSDVLPLVVGRIASLVFSIQQWTEKKYRHPIALLCDEAHLYIPERDITSGMTESSLRYFERIAKEGRKYGVSLIVISQRPSEVNKTVLSQCNNYVALRLSNAEDQNVIRRLLPDSLGGFVELLPVLDTGEALVVGDASLLPSRIRISEPRKKPDSGTVDFWDEWKINGKYDSIENAVKSWRKQSIEL
ncbi:ATP-binding protein [Anaerosolibacter sp.]|uniref:ATP-binding protein n=1 Tax=Anaerosolibacter sp. TaxID=1872527 RepID=UPI0039EF6384